MAEGTHRGHKHGPALTYLPRALAKFFVHSFLSVLLLFFLLLQIQADISSCNPGMFFLTAPSLDSCSTGTSYSRNIFLSWHVEGLVTRRIIFRSGLNQTAGVGVINQAVEHGDRPRACGSDTTKLESSLQHLIILLL